MKHLGEEERTRLRLLIVNADKFGEVPTMEFVDHLLDQKEKEERNRIVEIANIIQKNCSEADGIIDGITAIHALLESLENNER